MAISQNKPIVINASSYVYFIPKRKNAKKGNARGTTKPMPIPINAFSTIFRFSFLKTENEISIPGIKKQTAISNSKVNGSKAKNILTPKDNKRPRHFPQVFFQHLLFGTYMVI